MTPANSRLKGRNREAFAIQMADKLSAIGRLMLGEIGSWEEFQKPATMDYASLPRKQLKAGHADVRKRLLREIDTFYSQNFDSFSNDAI